MVDETNFDSVGAALAGLPEQKTCGVVEAILSIPDCDPERAIARYDRKLWIVEPVTPAACLPA